MNDRSLRPALDDDESEARKAAFRLLLARGEPIAPAALAEESGIEVGRLLLVLEKLDREGRIRRDDSGRVIGSAGLSVVPDRHEIELNGRRFWTWCAYDVLGIFGALGASGWARSRSPASGALLELQFTDGLPEHAQALLFRPDSSLAACCENVYEEWCPNSNLFEDEASARSWSKSHQLEGQILSLPDAAEQAAAEWKPLVQGLRL